MRDELRAIERDAREQGEADVRREHCLSAFRAFDAASHAWTVELVRLFGGAGPAARFQARGRTGETLEPLYTAFRDAHQAWRDAIEETK